MADTVKKPFNFKRLIVAAVALPLLILFVSKSSHYPGFFLLLLVITLAALREFHAMYKVSLKLSIAALVTGALLFLVMCSYPYYIIDAIFISFFLLLLIRLCISASPSGAMSELGPVAAGYLYILGFMVFQWLLRNDADGIYNIFLLYASVWLADSFAYYIGTYLGSHKLCPVLSPNKTYEGALGSLIGGAAGAIAVTSIYSFQESSILRVVIIGVVIGGVTIIGDLIESMFKRDAGVKDSGGIFPGHGGILDKLDGVLVAGPVLYFMLRFF